MAYIDLEFKARTQGEFSDTLLKFTKDLDDCFNHSLKTTSGIDRHQAILRDFLRFCNMNLVFLMPYYFPKYPKNKPLTFADYPFSFQMLAVLIGGSTTVRGSRQISKCRSIRSSEAIYADDGRPLYPNDIKIGQKILCVDDRCKRQITEIIALHRAGIQDVYEVTFRSGRKLLLSGNHQLRTFDGWTEVQDLQPGRKVAEIKQGGFFGARSVRHDRIALTAYMIGDGCCGCSGNFGFTSADPTALAEFQNLASPLQSIPLRVSKKVGQKAYQVNISRNSPLRDWLTEDGCYGKYSWEKAIPDWVFQLPESEARLFISRLWATDGQVLQSKSGLRQIAYSSTSKILADGVRSLLLKFGIESTITSAVGKYRKKDKSIKVCRMAYRVRIKGRQSYTLFQKFFNDIPGKPISNLSALVTTSNNNDDILPIEVYHILDAIRAACQSIPGAAFKPHGLTLNREYNPNREKLERYLLHGLKHVPHHPAVSELKYWLNHSDVAWSNIKSVKKIGQEDTWDIEVSEHSNYILDGVVSHNSTSFAVRQLMMARLFSKFSDMYIVPRSDQRDTYATRLREMEQALYDYKPNYKLRSNLNFKQFANGSKIELFYVNTTATNIRGKSTDSLLFDECLLGSSLLKKINKFDILVDCKPGDVIVCFDEHEHPKLDRIKRIVPKGKRPVWRINFTNGANLTCTSNERLRTNYGWLYLSLILSRQEAQRCPRAIHMQTVIRLRNDGTTPSNQSRLGQGELCLFDGVYPDLTILTLAVLPTGSSLPGEVERSAEDVKLTWTGIESITYVGEDDVYDVETEKHHTLFANGIGVHNCQDFDPDLEVETSMVQSASETPVTMYAGTSLTTDTFLEQKYGESSQGTWITPCTGCRKDNIPLPEHGVLDMIQPQGPSCFSCGKLLPIRDGFFVHLNRKAFNAERYGFHIPQLIVPAVYKNDFRWQKIYELKMKGDKRKFLQEVLGIPTEEGEREITRKNLQDICILGKDLGLLLRNVHQNKYRFIVSGCDWGGSDYQPMTHTKISTTVHLILGVLPTGECDILFIQRHTGMNYADIAGMIIRAHQKYQAMTIASDFGVGAVYNGLLREAIPPEKHLIFGYVGPTTDLISRPQTDHIFNQFSLNKTESLSMTFDAIRSARIRCFDWEYSSEYLLDCLNMFRAPGEKAGAAGTNTFVYRASASKPNDTLQALNYAFMLAKIMRGEPMFADSSIKIRLEQGFRGAYGLGNPMPGAWSG